jgi:hypothetical protein
MGVHGGDVEREQRLDVVAVELALVDGNRHGSAPSQRRQRRRGEGLTARNGKQFYCSWRQNGSMTYRISGLEPADYAALFDDPDVAYIHAHNAARGCFAAAVERHDDQRGRSLAGL